MMIYQIILKTEDSENNPIVENGASPTKLMNFLSDRINDLKAQKKCIAEFNSEPHIIDCLKKANYDSIYNINFSDNKLEVDVSKNNAFILSSIIPTFNSASIDFLNEQILLYSNLIANLLSNCHGNAACLGVEANGEVLSQTG